MQATTALRLALAATSAGAIAISGVGLSATAAVAANTVQKVRTSDISTWDATAVPAVPVPTGWFAQRDDQIGDGSYSLVAATSPQEGDGDGSLRLQTPTGADKVTLKKTTPVGTKLADVASGSYEVRTTIGAAPAYQIVIDCNGGTLSDGGFSTLNYIPTQTPADGWKTWDTVNGGAATYWSTWNIMTDGTTSSSTVPAGKTVAIPRFEPRPLSDFETACSAGLALTYGVSAGRDETHDANVDHVTFNGVESNFQVVTIDRYAGSDRVATAIAASQGLYPAKGNTGSARSAVVATALDFADGLAGGPLAVVKGGPLLLNNASFLDGRVATELQRLLPTGSTVYVLGGTGALSADVLSSIQQLGFTVVRVWGADRYATAVAIANRIGSPNSIFLTSGTDFPDALSASPAVARTSGVLLLTNGTSMAPATAAYIADNPTVPRYAIGGPSATAAGSLVTSANRIVGADRFATAVMTAGRFFPGSEAVAFASGLAFPDALGGGAFAGTVDAPMVLVGADSVPNVVSQYLATNRLDIDGAALFGGTGAVSTSVENALTTDLN